MKLKPVFVLSWSLWVATGVRAAGPEFTPETAVARALAHNADLVAARARVAEATARVGSAGRWVNPELETELKPRAGGREGAFSVGFNQRFPLTSRLRLEKELSRAEVAVAEAEVREAERRLALEVRQTVVRLAALRALEELRTRQAGNGRELAQAAGQAAQAGEGSELDVAQLELEIAQLDAQRRQLAAEAAEALGHLRWLLGWTNDVSPTVTMDLALPDPTEAMGSVAPRTDAAVLAAKQASAERAVEVARAGRWEDATIGIFGEIDRSEDAPEGLQTDGFVGVRFSVPLPIWNDHRGQVEAAAATAARLEKEADALALRVRAEIAAAQNHRTAADQWARTLRDSLLPKARQLEDRLTRLHAQGQASLTDALRARERRLQLEASELDARRDYHLAHARWMAATGQPLSAQP